MSKLTLNGYLAKARRYMGRGSRTKAMGAAVKKGMEARKARKEIQPPVDRAEGARQVLVTLFAKKQLRVDMPDGIARSCAGSTLLLKPSTTQVITADEVKAVEKVHGTNVFKVRQVLKARSGYGPKRKTSVPRRKKARAT